MAESYFPIWGATPKGRYTPWLADADAVEEFTNVSKTKPRQDAAQAW
jgi:hypothetical protein